MLSKNFYYRLKYQISKKATFEVLYNFVLDRLKHPFNYKIKKQKRDEHKNYLTAKHCTKDYFSLNAYYWHSIINKTFKRFSYLEIGSWDGNSAMFILKNFNTKNVTCVDSWDLYNDSSKSEQIKRFDNFPSDCTKEQVFYLHLETSHCVILTCHRYFISIMSPLESKLN